MKVYLYSEIGIYEGEDFCDARDISKLDGVTTVAPPDTEPGHITVYDSARCEWRQIPIEVIKTGSNV
jgi:hypothetical protein